MLMPISLGEHLEFYEQLGLGVIPLQPATLGDSTSGKRPILLDHTALNWAPYQQRKATLVERDIWWPRNVRGYGTLNPRVQNLAVVTGRVSHLVVVDIDDEESYDRILMAMPSLGDHMTVKSGRGYHIYLRPDHANVVPTSTFRLGEHLHHIKAEGGYVVAPPSAHYLGVPYALVDTNFGAAPALRTAELGEIAAAFVQAGAVVSGPSVSGEARDPSWISELLESETRQGQGAHDVLVRLAGSLGHVFGPRRRDQALAWLTLWNTTRCIPPLPERELEQALDHAVRREETKREAWLRSQGNAD